MSTSHTSQEIRKQTLQMLSKMGYAVQPQLPCIDFSAPCKSDLEMSRRALVMHACSAVAYGFPKQKATSWLETLDLRSSVSPQEGQYLAGGLTHVPFQSYPEGVWTLSWMLSKTDEFSLEAPVPLHAASPMPNLWMAESPAAWLSRKGVPREPMDAFMALDFYFCMHWAIFESQLKGEFADHPLPAYLVVERRRALEWCFSDSPWDEVSLDT